MRIYLAARFSRQAEMREVAQALRALGHTITARWIDGHDDPGDAYLRGTLNPEVLRAFAVEDLEDLWASECVISFTERPDADKPGNGGRHCEFGIALALGKRLVVVGPRENLFHCLEGVTVCADCRELFALLEGRR